MIIDQLFTQPIFEAADPSRLIATITLSQAYNADEPTKEVDLTGRFQGDVKSQMNQAADYLTQFLQSKGFNFTSIQLKYQGMVMNAQNRGSMTPQSDWEKEAEATANQMRAKRSVQNTAPALKEFAPSDDDSNGSDPEEMLRRMASHWWNGTERQMAKVENTLAALGWEIGQDDGYDDGGVFVVRAGDEHGRSYISWSADELEMNEAAPPGARAERMVKHIKQGYARDGKLTPKEKGIAFATAWKAHNAGRVEEATEDEYQDDYEDEETELCNGCYVRDKEDSSGEIFVMRGDPGDRRVRIEDRHGRGWNIAPYRLTVVDDSDPDIAAYFGDELDEAGVTEAAQGHTIEAHGVRGMDRRTWHKTFRNTDQMIAWAEKHDAEIIGTRDLEQARHGNLSPAKAKGVAEGKHFKTAYGWAGGSKPGGGTYKHPDQIKADREAKKKAKEQEQQKNKQPDVGVAEGSEQKPAITYKDYTLQYDYQTEDDDPEGYSTATTYYFDVLKDGDRVGEAEYFDYFGNLTIRINGKTKEFGFRHPLASQISQLVSSLPDEQKKDLSDPRFESQDLTEVFADQGSGSTGTSKEDKRIAAALRKKHIPTTPNDKKEKGVAEGEIEQTRTGIRHRGHRYGSGEELPNGGGNRSGFPNPGKYARDLDNLDKGLTSKLDHSMGVSWPHGNKKRDMDENIDPLMKKLRRAMVQEGRVKELADDLKTMSDADFMKKYGKAKAVIRADMKRVDEAGISRLGKKDIDFRDGFVGDEPEFFEPDVRIGKPVERYDREDEFMAAFQGAGGDNRFTAPAGWRYVEKGEDPARYGSEPAAAAAGNGLPNLIYDPQSRTLKSAGAPALDMSPKSKYKFDRIAQRQVPADGSGANPNIDAATRDRARSYAAQQNAPVDAAKKVDWKTIYALNKATIGSNPNVIRPRMQLNMPNGTIYLVQPGDTLTKIAAKQSQINELSTDKLAQYKTAAARDAKEADKAGDFKRGDKRFGGIVQATKKQFDNDAKKVDESRAARKALMARIVNHR